MIPESVRALSSYNPQHLLLQWKNSINLFWIAYQPPFGVSEHAHGLKYEKGVFSYGR